MIAGFFYGARFINNTLGTITNVNISYTGEQWRDSVANAQTINFFHRVGGPDFPGDVANVGWIADTALDFTSPQIMGGGIVLDGNVPANQVDVAGNISVNVPPGEVFWIRWVDLNDTGSEHFLGIDDLNITFNGINPAPALDGVTIIKLKPKTTKKLVVKTGTGILKKIKGFVVSESNTVSKVSYAAFGGTNTPTNLTFIAAETKVPKAKSKAVKKDGADLQFRSTKTTRPGADITSGPVTLLIKVVGGSNDASETIITNIYSNVNVK